MSIYKKYSALFLLLICICSAFFVTVGDIATAAESTPSDIMKDYVPLTPEGTLSGLGLNTDDITNVPRLLAAAFQIALGAAAALSVLMITLGGIEYMTTDAAYNKQEGKTKITHAIQGLILAIMAYLIMYIINPDTLEFKFLETSRSETSITTDHA